MKIKGCKLYLNGGYVRDKLLSIKPKDKDYTVITKMSFPNLVKEVEKVGEIFQTKTEFLTIRAKIDGEVVDLVLARSEDDYTDGRHPNKVVRVNNLEDDSKRRDFTINAMYLDNEGEVVDFHNGRDDLKRKIIRCVGVPEERFKEDYLRILRAVRFALRFEFGIEMHTLDAMLHYSNGLKNISSDRIREELNKCLIYNPQETIFYIHLLKLWDILKDKGLTFNLSNKKVKQ